MDACINPDILKVVYFFLLIVDIVKIVVPIALIIYGIIGFSKSVMSNDAKDQKKAVSIFFKRLLYAIIIFAVPWIVEVVMVSLGDVVGEGINFTDCLDNANQECIEALEVENEADIETACDADSAEKIGTKKEEEGQQEVCYYCESSKKYSWGTKASVICPGNYNTKKECTTNEPGEVCKRCELDSKWRAELECSSGWEERKIAKEKCK